MVISSSSRCILIWLYPEYAFMKDSARSYLLCHKLHMHMENHLLDSLFKSLKSIRTEIYPFFILTGTTLTSQRRYCTFLMKLSFTDLSTLASTLAARLCALRFILMGRLCGSIFRRCTTMPGSKHGISEYVHTNTSPLCFKNSLYISLSSWDIFLLMKAGGGSSANQG